MVAGGVSYWGMGKLMFCANTMDKTSYSSTLDYYKDDIDRISQEHNLERLFFNKTMLAVTLR